MEQFKLTPDLLTGFPEIDNQHRSLLNLANKVLFTDGLDKEPAFFHQTLSFLNNYIIYHFAAEEAAMDQFGYPRARFHIEFHDRLRRESAEIIARARPEGGSKEVKAAIYLLLEDWLIYHIRETDHELATFLQDRAPKRDVVRLQDIRALKSSGRLPKDFDETVAAGLEL